MKALLLAALLAALAVPANAKDETAFVTPGDAVTGHPDKTYSALLKQLIPDLQGSGDSWTGTLSGRVHTLDGNEPGEVPEPLAITYLDIRVLDGDGKPNIWVMADAGDGGRLGTYTLLAVFDGRTLKLLDAAEVDSDRLTGFIDTPLRISPKDEAVLVDSEHSNSSQTYQSETLLFMRGGKIVPIASFFAFGTRDCTYTQYETLDVAAAPSTDRYWPITATITRRSATFPQDVDECPDPAWKDFRFKDYSAVYRWDGKAGKYVTTSKVLKDLEDIDGERF